MTSDCAQKKKWNWCTDNKEMLNIAGNKRNVKQQLRKIYKQNSNYKVFVKWALSLLMTVNIISPTLWESIFTILHQEP